MRYWLLSILFLVLLVGCKKESAPQKAPEKTIKFERDEKSVAFDSVLVTKKNDATLTAFYRSYDFGTVWNVPEMRQKIISLLADSEKEGLNHVDYNVDKIVKLEKNALSFSNPEMVDYDLLLTASVQKYLWHLSNGKLDPKKLYNDWDLKPNAININLLLSQGIQGDSIEKVVENIKPSHPVYRSLKFALEKIEHYPKDTIKTIPFVAKIVRNDTNSSIIGIKRKLIFWRDMKPTDTLTKVYDQKTVKAVKNFQRRHGLGVDGVIGKGTIDALNFTRIQRKRQIIANLERWRWYPRDFGDHYVILNIPGYYLRIIKDRDTIARKRIVVGKIERKTPILSATFNNIVFNPTWTVPPTILREDLVPAATNNRGYFAARSITIYNSKGVAVDPQEWNPNKANAYRYVQAPSYNNSLGVVKFNFPNRYTVYLHDTNHRDYFGKNYRSLSSGCVRVEDPLPMAEYMINDSIRWPRVKIDTLIASKKTTTIPLKQKIRLHQLYWTAWMEKNGEFEFRDDIYNLDASLYDKLRQ
jgi:murein L,D-transpeptidase YcbB/YkuD